MRTGFDNVAGEPGEYENTQANAIFDIVTPVIENSMILACKYAKACCRDVVVAQDLEYAAKYCIMYTVGLHIGPQFPEPEDEDHDEELEVVHGGEELWTRYEGDDAEFIKINEAVDSWDAWTPSNPSEIILKNAIDSNGLL
tara:strand:- start:56 stop:478 length:423 start_codon:yes stop_codon:yes gene_type:complete